MNNIREIFGRLVQTNRVTYEETEVLFIKMRKRILKETISNDLVIITEEPIRDIYVNNKISGKVKILEKTK